jgi:parallel beta-helix repeat protein
MECSPFFRIGLLVLAAMIATPIVSAATVQISGPTVISSPGTYVLTQDIATGQSPAIAIRCSNVVFDGNGHTIDGVDASGSFGIQVNNGNTPLTGVTVKNVRLKDWYYGLYYKYENGGRIEDVRAESNQNAGICLAYANDNVLTGCSASGNEQGILVSFDSSRNRIESCTMSGNDDAGLWLASTGRGTNGITYDSTANQVTGNTATGNGRMGLYVDFSAGNVLSSNTVSGNGGYQIFLDYSSSNQIVSNTVSGGSEQGVYLYDADSCTISGNTVSGAADYGLYISSTTGLVISGNTLTHNGVGGIALNGEATIPADGNRVVSNTVRDNGQHGIYICRSGGNTITNNLFSNPVNVVYGGTCGASTWSASQQNGASIVGGPTLGGNFWGTPSGTGFSETTADADRNGICDRPFVINSGNSDLLPLARTSGTGTGVPTATPTGSSTPTPTLTFSSTPSPTATAAPTVTEAPYPSAHSLPCTIEAEQFDTGSDGVAYHDYESANLGTNTDLRSGAGVDIDTDGGTTNVGYTRDGEYLKYSVDAATPGSFSLALRAANPDPAAKAMKVYLDGVSAGQVPVGSTGGWTTYQDFSCSAPIAFPAGRHIVTIAFEGVSRINLDRLVFSAAGPAVTAPSIAPTTIIPTTAATPPPIVFPSSTPTATPTTQSTVQNVTLPALSGTTNPPRDIDGDSRYEDVNGNGRTDFNDVTLLFTNLNSVVGTYPAQTFDFNGNARVDYGDVTVLYSRL